MQLMKQQRDLLCEYQRAPPSKEEASIVHDKIVALQREIDDALLECNRLLSLHIESLE